MGDMLTRSKGLGGADTTRPDGLSPNEAADTSRPDGPEEVFFTQAIFLSPRISILHAVQRTAVLDDAALGELGCGIVVLTWGTASAVDARSFFSRFCFRLAFFSPSLPTSLSSVSSTG
jgi:hypothetical protein